MKAGSMGEGKKTKWRPGYQPTIAEVLDLRGQKLTFRKSLAAHFKRSIETAATRTPAHNLQTSSRGSPDRNLSFLATNPKIGFAQYRKDMDFFHEPEEPYRKPRHGHCSAF